MTTIEKERLIVYKVERDKYQARKDFWKFCRLLAPDFYKADRWHLKKLCEILQTFYERALFPDGKVYTKLMLNVPPRHGKSRTLIMFVAWILGQNKQERIIEASYNDDLASDFSRYTRDIILEEKSFYDAVVYTDIFPDSRIESDDKSIKRWALEGEFFNYKATGIGGSFTGRGATMIIIDDPVKNAEHAYNDLQLEKDWYWYTGTLLSRKESGCLEIVNMSRWAKKDLCGRLLEAEGEDWYILKEVAKDEKTDEMLCSEIQSAKEYAELERNMDRVIFRANYHQEPIDVEGAVYRDIIEYADVPKFERIISYTDTADEGDCYLCTVVGGAKNGELWIIDIYYSKAGMEVTEPETAKFLLSNDVNDSIIESNSGGRGFARNVERILWDKYRKRSVNIKWFHQSENKIARILTHSHFVMKHVFFPENWTHRWPGFARDLLSFTKDGKNKYLDAPDALTGLVESVERQAPRVRYI